MIDFILKYFLVISPMVAATFILMLMPWKIRDIWKDPLMVAAFALAAVLFLIVV